MIDTQHKTRRSKIWKVVVIIFAGGGWWVWKEGRPCYYGIQAYIYGFV